MLVERRGPDPSSPTSSTMSAPGGHHWTSCSAVTTHGSPTESSHDACPCPFEEQLDRVERAQSKKVFQERRGSGTTRPSGSVTLSVVRNFSPPCITRLTDARPRGRGSRPCPRPRRIMSFVAPFRPGPRGSGSTPVFPFAFALDDRAICRTSISNVENRTRYCLNS